MTHRDYRESPAMLAAWTIVAAAYVAVVDARRSLTGHHLVDGLIGMALGLYICTYPAANMIDLIFGGVGGRRRAAGWPRVGWVLLNLGTLGVAWLMITAGVLRAAFRG